MKTKSVATASILALAVSAALLAKPTAPSISGDYLEVRTCDIYTGYCVANSEMGLSGKEGMLVWAIRDGVWKGTPIGGLNVIAVVQTDETLGDMRYQPRQGKAVLIVDDKADARQKAALTDFARAMAGKLVSQVAEVKTAAMDVALGACTKAGCAKVKAGDLVEISTRCLNGKDHLCGNEETYYPPLTQVSNPMPAYTEIAAYSGDGLNLTWESADRRSAFLATFAR